MRALTVEPGQAGSACVEDVPEPERERTMLIRTLAIGVCGTDAEIVAGEHGWPPVGERRLIIDLTL